jgi:hypothetical protein
VVRIKPGNVKVALHPLAQLGTHLRQCDQFTIGNGFEVGQVDFLGHKTTAHITESYFGHWDYSSEDGDTKSGSSLFI